MSCISSGTTRSRNPAATSWRPIPVLASRRWVSGKPMRTPQLCGESMSSAADACASAATRSPRCNASEARTHPMIACQVVAPRRTASSYSEVLQKAARLCWSALHRVSSATAPASGRVSSRGPWRMYSALRIVSSVAPWGHRGSIAVRARVHWSPEEDGLGASPAGWSGSVGRLP